MSNWWDFKLTHYRMDGMPIEQPKSGKIHVGGETFNVTDIDWTPAMTATTSSVPAKRLPTLYELTVIMESIPDLPPLPPDDKCVCCGGVGVFEQHRRGVYLGTYGPKVGNVCKPCFDELALAIGVTPPPSPAQSPAGPPCAPPNG